MFLERGSEIVHGLTVQLDSGRLTRFGKIILSITVTEISVIFVKWKFFRKFDKAMNPAAALDWRFFSWFLCRHGRRSDWRNSQHLSSWRLWSVERNCTSVTAVLYFRTVCCTTCTEVITIIIICLYPIFENLGNGKWVHTKLKKEKPTSTWWIENVPMD